jgi:hypothetical protein
MQRRQNAQSCAVRMGIIIIHPANTKRTGAAHKLCTKTRLIRQCYKTAPSFCVQTAYDIDIIIIYTGNGILC